MRTLSKDERQALELEGARLIPMVIGWKCVDRRVESVTYLSEARVLREVSITLTLPDHVEPAMYPSSVSRQAARPFYYLPLTLIDKEKMTRFDFTDEQGDSLPLLGSAEKGAMAAGLLIALASTALAGTTLTLTDEIEGELREIAEAPPQKALKLLDGLRDRAALGEVWKALHGESRNAKVLRALLRAFAQCYIMLVPLTQGEHQKRLIKFSYEENITFKIAPPLEGHIIKRITQWMMRSVIDLTRTFGWRARQIWLGAPAFGHGGTYHLEMSAPAGTKITQMTLVGMTVTPAPDGPHGSWTSSQDQEISAPHDEQTQPHICCRDQKPGAFAVAYAKIRPTSPTVIRAAFCAAAGTALVLAVGLHFLRHVLAAPNEVEDAGAALLLAVPTAASVYISRVQEHPMVTSMLLGVRMASLLSGASAYAAAGVLILSHYTHVEDTSFSQAKAAWIVCVIGATLAASILMGTYFATWKEDQELVPRWKRYKERWASPPTYPPPQAS
jgi:hypothetical protein